MRILRSRLLARPRAEKPELHASQEVSGGDGRAGREDPHLQLPAEQGHGPQDRLHHQLAEFLDGKIDELVDALLEDEDKKRLEEASQV